MRHDEESAKTNENWEAAPQRIQRQTPHIARLGLPKSARRGRNPLPLCATRGCKKNKKRKCDCRENAGKRKRREGEKSGNQRQINADTLIFGDISSHIWGPPPLTWFSSCFSWAPHRRNSVCDILTQLPCDIYSAISHALSSLRHPLCPL